MRQTGATSEAHSMGYNCEVSKNLFSTCPTWSFLMFSLLLILGALISFITGASCGIIINWVLDFSQSLLHSNRQRTNTPEVFRLDWTSTLTTYRLMPLELGNDPNQHWYFIEYNEFKPVFLFCPWTLETPTEQLKVIITRIDFTLKRQFRLRLQVYPEGEPLFSKLITWRNSTSFLHQLSPLFDIITNFQNSVFPKWTWQLSIHS